ncbi:MAG TPA: hypothetical protein VHS96_00485 [Bacteroidia bacterium]|jgi:hypothetical protein|nr:hypothetical protein [Bacteroidia bacterium]
MPQSPRSQKKPCQKPLEIAILPCLVFINQQSIARMKRIFLLLVFVGAISSIVAGQCNNGGNGNSNGNNGNGPAWQAPGGVPPWVAIDALREAAPYFQQQLGLNFGQLVAKYAQGICTITQVSPPENSYRVVIGGTGITVLIDIL